MSSSESDEESVLSDDSDYNYIPGVYEVNYETFEDENATGRGNESSDEGAVGPYADEPLADQQWLEEYRKKREEKEQRLSKLRDRLDETVGVSSWCTCGNCNVEILQNPCECQCCREIPKCVEALSSKLVLKEMEHPPECIIQHPGFRSVCIDRWSLRQAAGKYRTMEKKKYKQTGLEETYLRSISYREFTQLVHGQIGSLRIPLPACAYHCIRKEINDPTEAFRGYEEEDED